MIHEQTAAKGKKTTSKKKESLIRNATLSTMLRPINGKKYKIENSSIFDSIAEIMAVAYKNIKDFTDYCDDKCLISHKNCFLKIVKDYCKSGTLATFYKERSHFLFEYGYIENYVISIRDNLGDFFVKCMQYYHNSYEISIYCVDCNHISYDYYSSIKLLFAKSEHICDLENKIKNYFTSLRANCHTCKDLGISSPQLGSYLCINLESNNYSCKLCDVPVSVELKNEDGIINKYVLVGIVSEQEGDEVQRVAYCRLITGYWDKRKNIAERICTVKKLPEVKLLLIIYVRINCCPEINR